MEKITITREELEEAIESYLEENVEHLISHGRYITSLYFYEIASEMADKIIETVDEDLIDFDEDDEDDYDYDFEDYDNDDGYEDDDDDF